ncbi:MAG TPA: T9SS type A sorting domain-containing protein, partial [Bacteroidales bacterium]|nr:T9SS type A sorting domain-containing protein [Bacteroidales bacterium]
ISLPNAIVDIVNNAPGCNSPEEVEESCNSCLPNGITFTSQEQIDNFFANYPGCNTIKGNVEISGNFDITNLDGLLGLKKIEGQLLVDHNYELHNFIGLDSLKEALGMITIANNIHLVDFTGLESLATIGDNLMITENDDLINLAGLESLTVIPGSLGIGENPSLLNLNGLENLENVGSLLFIDHNEDLLSLDGLINLSNIGEDLIIETNHSLVDITALSNLSTIGDYLYINENISLQNLFGLDSLQPNSINDLTITGNSVLSDCDVLSICQYLAAPGGTVDIQSNAPGCNSQEEVEAACLTGFSELEAAIPITIFPNPANETISITANNHQQINVVNIYDLAGELVLNVEKGKNEIDIRSLKPGMYLLEVIQKNHAYRSKLIIQ